MKEYSQSDKRKIRQLMRMIAREPNHKVRFGLLATVEYTAQKALLATEIAYWRF